jgi:hypothetical protein
MPERQTGRDSQSKSLRIRKQVVLLKIFGAPGSDGVPAELLEEFEIAAPASTVDVVGLSVAKQQPSVRDALDLNCDGTRSLS